MTKNRNVQIERFQAQTPNGRLLLVERCQDLGCSPKLQHIISTFLIPTVFVLALLIGPRIPIATLAGILSLTAFMFSAVAATAIVQAKLLRWMQSLTHGSDTCEVVGMDCSTDALLAKHRAEDLKEALDEALDREPTWRRRIETGAKRLTNEYSEPFVEMLNAN